MALTMKSVRLSAKQMNLHHQRGALQWQEDRGEHWEIEHEEEGGGEEAVYALLVVLELVLRSYATESMKCVGVWILHDEKRRKTLRVFSRAVVPLNRWDERARVREWIAC